MNNRFENVSSLLKKNFVQRIRTEFRIYHSLHCI